MFGSFSYSLWVAAFILPAYKYENYKDYKGPLPLILRDGPIITLNLVSAFLLGLGAGPLWVSQ